MKRKFIILFIILSFFICGCAPWLLVKMQYKWRYANFEAVLPEGWMKASYTPDILFLTKDGIFLQSIRIYRYQIGKDKALPITKKKFTDEMLPQEISELIVNEMSLDKNYENLKVLENIPEVISGRDGFRLKYTFHTADNLKLKAIVYGFKENKYIYLIQYQAAEQHYFDKDLEAFNNFINNFKIL